MEYTQLADEKIENILNRVQGLSAVGTSDQVQSIMALIARCTIELSGEMVKVSEEIEHFNQSTSKLTKVLIALNCILAIGTIVGAVAAFWS